MRIHSGEKPFTCPDCSLPFRLRGTYKRHLSSKHNKILARDNSVTSAPPKSAPPKKRRHSLRSTSQSSTDDASSTAPTEADHPLAKRRKAPEMDDMSSVIGYTRDGRPITVGASYLMGFAATAKLSE